MSSLTSPLESCEARARVAEGELDTCTQGPGLMTVRLVEQELQEQKLPEDLVSRELVLISLKEEVVACKRKLMDKEKELTLVKQEWEAVSAKSEALLEETRQEKNQLSSQVTSVSLARDALEEEARYLREEVAKLKGQEEVAQIHVTKITLGIDELVSRLATRDLEVADLRLRAASLDREVKRLEGVAEEWRLKAKGEEWRARELEEELSLGRDKLEGLDDQEFSLKSRLEEVSKQQEQEQLEVVEQKTNTRVAHVRGLTPPSASLTDSLQLSLKRPVDLETDSDYQKKARKNISKVRHLQVSSSTTEQDWGSSDMEERGQVGCINQYSRDLEEVLGREQEENSCESVAMRTEEGADAGSSPLQTLEHVCPGCQSVFSRAATLRHHQAVAGRCKRVREPEPQELACHRCFKPFNSKGHLSKHVSFVLDCADKIQQRKDKMMEEVGILEVQGPGEELCQVAHAEVVSAMEVLPAGSPVSLSGLEVTVSPEGDHCYALSSALAPEQRQSSNNPGQPVQV